MIECSDDNSDDFCDICDVFDVDVLTSPHATSLVSSVFHILIVTPTSRHSRQGNRVTADRWAKILCSLGNRVVTAEEFKGQRCDILIALHARKSAASIRRFVRKNPKRPVVVALTGTDLYGDIRTSRSAQQSLELASRLILLQPHGRQQLPARLHSKTRVIYQSATRPTKRTAPLEDVFEICVSGHLRAVKDPFRAAFAARTLPSESKISITHIGAALSAAMEKRARAEMRRNPRYHWLGEVPRWKACRLLARSRLVVLSSKMEGGANVISEALAATVPILSTKISGSIGLLGDDYPGYFDVGDTAQLAKLLMQFEREAAFRNALRSHCGRRAALVKPQREVAAWRDLIDKLPK